MNVTVFGAIGAIGRLIVADLLAAGHTVTAYLRDAGGELAGWERAAGLPRHARLDDPRTGPSVPASTPPENLHRV